LIIKDDTELLGSVGTCNLIGVTFPSQGFTIPDDWFLSPRVSKNDELEPAPGTTLVIGPALVVGVGAELQLGNARDKGGVKRFSFEPDLGDRIASGTVGAADEAGTTGGPNIRLRRY